MFIKSGLRLFAGLTALITCLVAASIPQENPQNPTIVLVPGAWHSPQHFFELQSLLERSGYNTSSQQNPSCDSPNPNAEPVSEDAAFIRGQMLFPLLDAGKTVVLVMHSYGGSPGATAAKGLSKAERAAAGQPGGIIGLIFISAILPHDGQSLLDIIPGHAFGSWVIQKDDGQLDVSDPKDVFYGLVSGRVAQKAIGWLKPQSRISLTTPSGPPAWMDSVYDGRRAYWLSLQDQSIPPAAQEGMIQGSGVPWIVKRFPSDHSPFLSYPQALASWMISEMRSWQGLSVSNSTAISSGLDFDSVKTNVSARLNSNATDEYGHSDLTVTS